MKDSDPSVAGNKQGEPHNCPAHCLEESFKSWHREREPEGIKATRIQRTEFKSMREGRAAQKENSGALERVPSRIQQKTDQHMPVRRLPKPGKEVREGFEGVVTGPILSVK